MENYCDTNKRPYKKICCFKIILAIVAIAFTFTLGLLIGLVTDIFGILTLPVIISILLILGLLLILSIIMVICNCERK